MFSKKILASVSAVALLSGAPAVVSAADADKVVNKGQIFKTGKGTAAGQAAAAPGRVDRRHRHLHAERHARPDRNRRGRSRQDGALRKAAGSDD